MSLLLETSQLPLVSIFQEGNGYNPGSTMHLFTMMELTINMRLMGDNSYSQVYRVEFDLTHLISGIDTSVDVEQSPFIDALPLKVMVVEYNTHCLWQLVQALTVFEFKGKHSSDSARQSYSVIQHADVQRDSSHPMTTTVPVYQEV